MKRPAVFFDRDNTLIVSDGYLGDPSKVVLMDGAANAIAKARQYGFKIVTISNQSGVARGMFTEADVNAVNTRMDEMLKSSNPAAGVHLHLFCPFHPEAAIDQYRQESDLRKPKPGMLLQAADKLNLDLSRSWVIGDAPRDIEAGKAAGCRTILFHPPVENASPAAEAQSDLKPDFEVASLKEAIEIIAREAFRKNGSPAPAAVAPSPTVPDEPEESQAAPAEAPQMPTLVQAPQPPPQERPSTSRTESLLEQVLVELKRRPRETQGDFSVSKLMAGMVQVLALGTLFMAYLNRGGPALISILLTAIFLQTLTIALLIMGRQR